MFKYDISSQDSKTIVTFEGDMDIDVTELMEEEIEPELLKSKEKIEIDFAKVPFVDSSGIGLLITLVKNLKDHGIEVVIKNLSPEVKTIFTFLDLPEILGCDVLTDFC